MESRYSAYKSKSGATRLIGALRYSYRGLLTAIRHEAAFRQELLFVAILVPIAIWLGRSPGEVLLLVAPLIVVLLVELLNSAIEALADSITLEHHPLIGRAKDLGSAAVFMAILLAAGVWAAVLYSRV